MKELLGREVWINHFGGEGKPVRGKLVKIRDDSDFPFMVQVRTVRSKPKYWWAKVYRSHRGACGALGGEKRHSNRPNAE